MFHCQTFLCCGHLLVFSTSSLVSLADVLVNSVDVISWSYILLSSDQVSHMRHVTFVAGFVILVLLSTVVAFLLWWKLAVVPLVMMDCIYSLILSL